MNNMATQERKKSRLSRFLNKSRGEESSFSGPGDRTSFADSAYEGSLTPPSQNDVGTFDNHGQIPGVAADRDLVLDKKTGEVVDSETGEVVITTVTTTTTTTRMRGGKAIEVETTTSPGQPPQASTPGGTPVPIPATEVSSTDGHSTYENVTPQYHARGSPDQVNAVPVQSNVPHNQMNAAPMQNNFSHNQGHTMPVAAEMPVHQTHQAQQQAPVELSGEARSRPHSPINHSAHLPVPGDSSPKVPHRNPNRASPVSQPNPDDMMSPVSPIDTQQSFNHGNERSGGFLGRSSFGSLASNSSRASGGSLANLKAAAVGLHGVGETLRGTFNDSIDRRVPRSNTQNSAAANTKNQAVLDRGRNEIQGLFSNRPNPRTSGGMNNQPPTA